jgi:hypothetical protein
VEKTTGSTVTATYYTAKARTKATSSPYQIQDIHLDEQARPEASATGTETRYGDENKTQDEITHFGKRKGGKNQYQ